MFSERPFLRRPIDTDPNDIGHPSSRATLFRALADAVDPGVILYDSSYRMVADSVPELRDVETAEVERYWRELVASRVRSAPTTVVVLNTEREIVVSVDFPAEATRDRMASRIERCLRKKFQTGKRRSRRQRLEAYVLPHGEYEEQPILVRKRGVALCTVEFHPENVSTSTVIGIERDFVPQYLFAEDAPLERETDFDGLLTWTDRRLIRATDRLLEVVERERVLCEVFSDRPFAADNAAALRDRLSVRVFALFAALSRKGYSSLLERAELRLAMRFLPRKDHPELPRWVADHWLHYRNRLEGLLSLRDEINRDSEARSACCELHRTAERTSFEKDTSRVEAPESERLGCLEATNPPKE